MMTNYSVCHLHAIIIIVLLVARVFQHVALHRLHPATMFTTLTTVTTPDPFPTHWNQIIHPMSPVNHKAHVKRVHT